MHGFSLDTPIKLYSRLFPEANVSFYGSSTGCEGERQGQLPELRQCAYSGGLELTALEPAHSRDERKVVVVMSPLVAEPLPSADFAMLHWFGVVILSKQRRILKRGRLQPIADQSKICGEVLDPIFLNGRHRI